MGDIALYIESHSRIPFITTNSVELFNILKVTLGDIDADYYGNFLYPSVVAVTLSDIERIKEAVESVSLTLEIIEIERNAGSWSKGVDSFLSGKTYFGRNVSHEW